MACENGIVKSIISNCSTQGVGGIETVVYLVNREDIDTITYSGDVMVTDFTMVSGTTAYTATGIKKNMSYGSSRVVAEDAADRFTHSLNLHGYELDSASIENIDALADVVAIVERKEKSDDDGVFVMLGLGTGLYVSADDLTSTDANGRVITLSTMAGWEEKQSANVLLKTDYATTKSFLEGLL